VSDKLVEMTVLSHTCCTGSAELVSHCIWMTRYTSLSCAPIKILPVVHRPLQYFTVWCANYCK